MIRRKGIKLNNIIVALSFCDFLKKKFLTGKCVKKMNEFELLHSHADVSIDDLFLYNVSISK